MVVQVVRFQLAEARFYLGIFVWGGSSGEGIAQDVILGGKGQKILNFRSPETQFREP